jgi:hypothetical protein
MIAYKIVEKTEDGNYKFLFHNRKTPLEFGKELQAEKKMVYESYNRDGTKKLYMSGIHVVETPELCIKYLGRFKDSRNKTILVCEADGCVPKPKGNPGVLLADKIIPLRELGDENYERGEAVVATYGYNSILKKPFEFLYEFGYYTRYGCVVYNKGERNMQDSSAFKLYQVRRATEEDLRTHFWGI